MVRTYDPLAIVVTLGENIITGFADGTFVNAERASDSFTKTVGASGEVARTRSRDKSGSITLTLMASSQANDLLTALYLEDELLGTGTRPLMVKDLNGTTLCSAINCWVKKPASVEFGKDLSNREWALDCDVLNMIVGGNL